MIYFIQYVCSMNLSVYRAGRVDGKGGLMGKYDRYHRFQIIKVKLEVTNF